MYSLSFIKKSLKLLEKYDGKITKTARELGIKVRTLTDWKQKKEQGKSLLVLPYKRYSRSKYTKEQRKIAIAYYFEHGQNVSSTCRKLGFPKRTTLRDWLCKNRKYQKLKNITPKESKLKPINNKGNKPRKINITFAKEGIVYQKALRILKKKIDPRYDELTSKEKTIVVNELSTKFKIKDLCKLLNLNIKTYYYECKALKRDKYEKEREIIKGIFVDNYSCYGYRRINQILRADYGIVLSEKVILRIMKEEKLIVYKPRTKKYSSYRGEISSDTPNVIQRDFKSDKPNVKLLTDITEFALKDGKVYLSPMIDCFTGTPITWKIGFSPNTKLTNDMLAEAIKIIDGENAVIHSDRGFHYRVQSWIDIVENNNCLRSMSKKGCSPDNSACEGFFGTIKNEFFYSRDWSKVGKEEFAVELDKYLNWFVSKRIKARLNYKSSKDYLLEYKKSK